MGTKARSKGATSDGVDPRKAKTKKPWIVRMIRKRKYKSLSEENLNDTAKDIEKEPDRADIMENDPTYLKQESVDDDDIVVETMSELDGEDHRRDDLKDSRKKSSDGGKKKFGSALKFLKHSFSKNKKRKKQNEYAKFSEFVDDLTTAGVNGYSQEGEKEYVQFDDDEALVDDQSSSHKYVRFEPGVEEEKENAGTTIDTETTEGSKKKKKSAKKRVAKAGRQTGRVFSAGMMQIGRNLQYLTPMPSPHVFADASSSSKSSGHSSRTSKPKKQNYKHTASAPPSNPYAFL